MCPISIKGSPLVHMSQSKTAIGLRGSLSSHITLSNLKSLCRIVVAWELGRLSLKWLIKLSNLFSVTLLSDDCLHLSAHPFNCLKTKPSGFPKFPKPTSSGLILCKSEIISIILKPRLLM